MAQILLCPQPTLRAHSMSPPSQRIRRNMLLRGAPVRRVLWVICAWFALADAFSLPTPPLGTAVKIPEEVVQRQLNAFAECNVAQAFEYNSPTNQDLVGPWESFAAALSEPAFRPILGHTESSVLMTISHDEGDYVCCLVKIVPGKDALPESLQKVIAQNRQDEGFQEVEDDNDDDNDDADTEICKKLPPCVLYWWEVSKQFDNEDDPEDYYYQVDSLLPDAEDLEMDYMETTLFSVEDEDDEYDEDDEDDEDDGFFFDLGLS
jgi:hypothetical protein